MTELTPAQERMAVARAARAAKQAGAPEGLATTASFIPPVPPVADNDDDLSVRAATQAVARELAELSVPEPQEPTNNVRVAEKQAADAELRIRAARQRAAAGIPDPVSQVRVRVTKQGDGKISMGQHVPGIGEAYYEWKEELSLPEPIAKGLEERYFVEIL